MGTEKAFVVESGVEITRGAEGDIGLKFGDWEVIGETKKWNNSGWWESMWVCRCKCGVEAVQTKSNLRAGKTKACRTCAGQKSKKDYDVSHKLYPIWVAMKQRCLNPKNKYYKNNGSRGISVFEEWVNDFGKFLGWCISNGWKEGLQLDRKDNDGNYEPSNCRFISIQRNLRNRRTINSLNTTGFRGISKLPTGRYKAIVIFESTNFRLGYEYKTPEEAARARDEFIVKCKIPHSLNFPDKDFDRELAEQSLDVEECLRRGKEELKRIREERKANVQERR